MGFKAHTYSKMTPRYFGNPGVISLSQSHDSTVLWKLWSCDFVVLRKLASYESTHFLIKQKFFCILDRLGLNFNAINLKFLQIVGYIGSIICNSFRFIALKLRLGEPMKRLKSKYTFFVSFQVWGRSVEIDVEI